MKYDSEFEPVRFPVLPKGTRAVSVREIPYLLAETLYPMSRREYDDWQLIHRLMKRRVGSVDDEQALGPLEALDEDDWKSLRSVWKTLPSYRDGMGEDEWRPYAEAFEKADPWESYELWPVWDDGESLREEARKNYAGWLHKAIQDGSIKARTGMDLPLFDPTGELLLGAEVSVHDFKRFVAMLEASTDQTCSPPTAPLVPQVEQNEFPPASWQAQAYRIAKRWQSERRRDGVNPGQEDIAEYVAKYMKNNKLFGKHKGKSPSAGTIRKEVLIGRVTKETDS